MEDTEISRRLIDTLQSIRMINDYVVSLHQRESDFHIAPNEKIADEINRLISTISSNYANSLENLNYLINTIESTATEDKMEDQSSKPTLPEVSVIQGLLDQLFYGKIKTRVPPHQKFTGSYSHLFLQPSFGNYICARINNAFSLAIVIALNGDELTAIDPSTYTDTNKQVIKLKQGSWVSLPLVIPDKQAPRWEYSVGSEVLALKKEDGKYGFKFYKATVVARPFDIKDTEEERGYRLKYPDDEVLLVPEQFVVTIIGPWKPLVEKMF